jgi:hypothetical protein
MAALCPVECVGEGRVHGQQVTRRWDVARPDHAPTPTQARIRARIDPMRPTCLDTWVVSRAAEGLGVGNMAVVSGVYLGGPALEIGTGFRIVISHVVIMEPWLSKR